MAKTKTYEWDPSERLETREQMAHYLEAALDDGDTGVIAAIAEATGLGRESLYKSLSEDGNPEFSTVLKVVEALGLKLTASPSDSDRAA